MGTRKVWVVVGLVLATCGGKPPAAPPGDPPEDRRTPYEKARAAERGDGVARDYELAFRHAEAGCAAGAGDPASCRFVVRALIDGRGVARDRGRVIELVDRMCRHDDLLGCVIAAFAGLSSMDEKRLVAAKHKADLACGHGDALACEVMMELRPTNFGGSGAVEEQKREVAALACRAGLLDGCIELIDDVSECAYRAGAARCVAKQIAYYEEIDDSAALDALARVRAACDGGDALACDALPGREIGYAERCDAGDFGACNALGCLGNRGAGARARAHGVDESCGAVLDREAARREPPPPTRDPLPPEPPLPAFTPAKLPPLRALAFRHLGTPLDSWAWPQMEIANLSDRKLVHLLLVAYAFDRGGRQVSRARTQVIAMMMPAGAVREMTFRSNLDDPERIPTEAVAFAYCVEAIAFDDDGRDAFVGTHDAAGCPAQATRASLGDRLELSGASSQGPIHAAAGQRVRYTTIAALPEGGSARGLADLAAGWSVAAGSDVPGPAGTTSIPVAIAAVGVIHGLRGVDELRLSPATLARIIQRDITQWDDRAIRADNPGTKLPHLPIKVFREAYLHTGIDLDGDTTRQLTAYLTRAAPRVWRLGDGAGFAWPKGTQSARGLVEIVSTIEGAISIVTVSTALAERHPPRFALIRNRAGHYVAPTEAALAAAAAAFTGAPGAIDAGATDAYPIVYPSWLVVPAAPAGASRAPLLAYVRDLLGDGQATLAARGYAPLPAAVRTQSLKQVDGL